MMFSGDIFKMFSSAGKFYQFTSDLSKGCKFNDITFDLVGFCLNSSNNCTADQIV